MLPNDNRIYAIVLSSAARRSLKKINKPDSKNIFEKLKQLSASRSNLDIKKLAKYKNLYRLRCGNYRIIYEPLHQEIIIHVVHIGPRPTVYNDLERLVE
jgi:mRNA interferase RelE/StbE